jgi:hypothetical protein
LFLPLYDLIAKLFGADGARQTLFDLAPLLPGDRVLDIVCLISAAELAPSPRC